MTNAIISASATAPPAVSTTIPNKEEPCNVHINEITDPAIIRIVNSYTRIPLALQAEIIGHKGKNLVFDKNNRVGSYEIKSKEACAPTDVVFYVYVFQAIRDVLSKKKEDGKSKMPLFHKDNYVHVFSRRGDCFPEKDDDVIIRSDLKNKTNSIMKPQLYKRKFCEVRDNCVFLGRLTCRFTATVVGKTHAVNNNSETITVFGIPVICNKIDQSSRAAGDAHRVKNYNVIWLDYDKRDAAAAEYSDLDVVAYGRIFLPCDQEQRYMPSSPVSAISTAAATSAAAVTATQPVMHATTTTTAATAVAVPVEEKEDEKTDSDDEESDDSDDDDDEEEEEEEVVELEAGLPAVSAVAEQGAEMVVEDEDADRKFTIGFGGRAVTLYKLDDRVISRPIETDPAPFPLLRAEKRGWDCYDHYFDGDDYDENEYYESDSIGFYPPLPKKLYFE